MPPVFGKEVGCSVVPAFSLRGQAFFIRGRKSHERIEIGGR